MESMPVPTLELRIEMQTHADSRFAPSSHLKHKPTLGYEKEEREWRMTNLCDLIIPPVSWSGFKHGFDDPQCSRLARTAHSAATVHTEEVYK